MSRSWKLVSIVEAEGRRGGDGQRQKYDASAQMIQTEQIIQITSPPQPHDW